MSFEDQTKTSLEQLWTGIRREVEEGGAQKLHGGGPGQEAQQAKSWNQIKGLEPKTTRSKDICGAPMF